MFWSYVLLLEQKGIHGAGRDSYYQRIVCLSISEKLHRLLSLIETQHLVPGLLLAPTGRYQVKEFSGVGTTFDCQAQHILEL